MTNLTLVAQALRVRIGAHHRLIGKRGLKSADYLRARSASDEAESTARYLIAQLADRALAERFANLVGMPAYIGNTK